MYFLVLVLNFINIKEPRGIYSVLVALKDFRNLQFHYLGLRHHHRKSHLIRRFYLKQYRLLLFLDCFPTHIYTVESSDSLTLMTICNIISESSSLQNVCCYSGSYFLAFLCVRFVSRSVLKRAILVSSKDKPSANQFLNKSTFLDCFIIYKYVFLLSFGL